MAHAMSLYGDTLGASTIKGYRDIFVGQDGDAMRIFQPVRFPLYKEKGRVT
jgi:hypothetical protein